jgi:Peroxiredoxin
MNFPLQTLLPLFSLLAGACIGQNDTDSVSLHIDLKSHGTIEFNFENAADSIILLASFNSLLPPAYVDSDPIKFKGNGKKYLNFQIQMPEKVSLSVSFISPTSVINPSDTILFDRNKNTTCFLVPGDTLSIAIDFSNKEAFPRCIKYSGKWAHISDYYKNKEIFFHKDNFIIGKAIAGNTAPDYETFSKVTDSLTNIELIYLKNYYQKSRLPKWFTDYEENDIRYISYVMKLSEPSIMKRIRNIDKPIPKDYYDFLKECPLNNPSAILSIYYYVFIDFYFSLIQMPYTDSTQKDTNYGSKRLNGFITSSIKNYDEYISDILLAFKLDEGIMIRYVPKEEYTLYSNAIRRADLKQYLEQRYVNKYVLKEGDPAPYFYIKNELNESVSVKNFAGNIVYITFWFVGCKGCIIEFPDENHLVEVFKNDKVSIVSICMYSSEESWKQAIEKYGIKSTTLICKGNWDKILKEKYDINAYPQHVLIDKQGKIISNKLVNIHEAEQEIRKWLNKE